MKQCLNNKFCDELRRLGALKSTILAAVSGGVDSMTMLHLLVETLGKENVQVAHCNFGLRDTESDNETILVKQTCQKLGVKCHTAHFNTTQVCQQTGENTQLAARRLRYKFFEEILSDNKLDKVAIAHNADDSIETFFINLLRGTGLRGLRGIQDSNGLIIRPLMFASRSEISQYADSECVPYLNDSSNMETDYLRNKLRLSVLPMFDELSVDFRQLMRQNMERLSAHYEFESLLVDKYSRELIINHTMHIQSFRDIAGASEFLLYMLLQKYGFSYSVVRDIYSGFENDVQGKRYFSDTHVALIDRQRLIIKLLVDTPAEATEEVIDRDDERLEWLDISDIKDLKTTPAVALFDADLLRFPLQLRLWREGDRFVPFGMSGVKKISRFLVDRKIALIDKKNVRVLVNHDGQIIWVVGLRSDDRFKITPKTKRLVRIKIEH